MISVSNNTQWPKVHWPCICTLTQYFIVLYFICPKSLKVIRLHCWQGKSDGKYYMLWVVRDIGLDDLWWHYIGLLLAIWCDSDSWVRLGTPLLKCQLLWMEWMTLMNQGKTTWSRWVWQATKPPYDGWSMIEILLW